jgi:hypothetical protein
MSAATRDQRVVGRKESGRGAYLTEMRLSGEATRFEEKRAPAQLRYRQQAGMLD